MSKLLEGAFWRFSLRRYAAPGVAEACLALQDAEGVDVNLILLGVWLGENGHRLRADDGARLARLADDWQGPIVAPLRAVRRRLKQRLDLPWSEAIVVWRKHLADVELAMEQLEQLALEQAVGPVAAGAPDAAAARANLVALGLGRILGKKACEHVLRAVDEGSVTDP